MLKATDCSSYHTLVAWLKLMNFYHLPCPQIRMGHKDIKDYMRFFVSLSKYPLILSSP